MATSLDQTDFMKTALRLHPDMHAEIQEWATRHGISLNSEYLLLFREALDARKHSTVDLSEKSLDAIEARVSSALKRK